jgi:hypothetical protein
MMKIIPVSSFLLALTAICSKFAICGKLHMVIVELYKRDMDVASEIVLDVLGAQRHVNYLLVSLAALSIVLAWFSLRGKLCGRFLGSVCLTVSLLSLCVVLLVVF